MPLNFVLLYNLYIIIMEVKWQSQISTLQNHLVFKKVICVDYLRY